MESLVRHVGAVRSRRRGRGGVRIVVPLELGVIVVVALVLAVAPRGGFHCRVIHGGSGRQDGREYLYYRPRRGLPL